MSEPVDYKNLNEPNHDDSDAWTAENDHAEEDAENLAEETDEDEDDESDEDLEEAFNNDNSELY